MFPHTRLLRGARHPVFSRPDGQCASQSLKTSLTDSTTEESELAVYAVLRAGSKQQKVAVGDVIEIDKIETGVGESLTLPVVMVVDGDKVTSTGLDKAGVTVEVLGATKGPKIVIQKYKNKTGYKKRQGHRQKYTQVKVTDITV